MKHLAPVYRVTSPGLLLVGLAILLQFLPVSCTKDSADETPLPVTRQMQVWLHRVNSIEKAQHFQELYAGFELDVHYEPAFQTYVVKHDFGDTSTLTFSRWLGGINHPERLGYWLDFKNLSPDNGAAALAELLRIRETFNLKTHPIVVEASYPLVLKPFDTLNFRPSYYIPWFDPTLLTTEDELMYRDLILERVTAGDNGTISGYSDQHGFMQKWFPDMNKLLWYLDSYDPVLQDSVIALTMKDPKVEVLLVAEDYPLQKSNSSR